MVLVFTGARRAVGKMARMRSIASLGQSQWRMSHPGHASALAIGTRLMSSGTSDPGNQGDTWSSYFNWDKKPTTSGAAESPLPSASETLPKVDEFQTGLTFPSDLNTENMSSTMGDTTTTASLTTTTDTTLLVDSVNNAAELAELSQWNPAHHMMKIIDNLHMTFDLPYWQAIIILGASLRLFMLPVSIKGMQTAARMQYVKPEMDKLNARMLADPLRVENKPKYDAEVKALFAKHNVNPFKQLTVPLLQIPVFFSMFFAIREMGTYYPGFATGGTQWFTDLTAADVTYALPVVNACLFLTIIELGGESQEYNNSQQNSQQKMMKNIFRAMGVAMVPLTMSFPQGLFVYWVSNGFWSIMQAVTFKNPAVKTYFDIPPPPPPAEVVVTETDADTAVSMDINGIKSDKSPFLKLYEENIRLIEANKKLMEKVKQDKTQDREK